MKPYRLALEKFIAPFKQDANVVGIILSGSYLHAQPDKNSDLDVYIIEKKNSSRERGNTWIDGFEIEYFINPEAQVRHYFELEDGKSPHTAHMFVHCEVLYQDGPILETLRTEALQYWKKPRPDLSEVQLELIKYSIDDCWKDIEDVYEKGDNFSFCLLCGEFIQKAIDAFGKVNGFYPDKFKRLEAQLKQINPTFANLINTVLLAKERKGKFNAISQLKRSIDQELGGARAEEWFLKSACTA